MSLKYFITAVLLYACSLASFAQANKYDVLYDTLNKLTTAIPALDEKVNISVTKVSIQEFLRAVANNTSLNIDVDPGLNLIVINNFSNVKVKDLLVYLCKQYDLEVNIIGNIISVYKNNAPVVPKTNNQVKYDTLTSKLSLDYSNESITTVVKDITRTTGKNIVLSPGLGDTRVSGYIQEMPFDNALEKFMYGNNLLVNKTDDKFYIVEQKVVVENREANDQSRNGRKTRSRSQSQSSDSRQDGGYTLDVQQISKDSVSVYAENAPASEIISEVAEKTGASYYLSNKIDDKTDVKVSRASFGDILQIVLNGTKFSFKKVDSLYFIGESNSGNLKENALVKLKHRSVEKLIEIIPNNLKENNEIKEFADLNAFMISGTPLSVRNFKDFVEKIDQSVPVVLIEVMIVETNKNFSITTGMEAGLADKKTTSSGSVFPNLDVTLGSDAVNKFLQSNNKLGMQNLGNVAPNFYVKINALEKQGLANIKSTPQLSTLNGHEATLSIGSTVYYEEKQSSFIGNQNPTMTSSQSYKSLNADLTITIKPFVAGDEQITLNIEVKRSDFDFSKRVGDNGPPGTSSSSFKSMIRVKNQDMVLLGGLEIKSKTDGGSGVPILSRIPVIKWFFSSKTNSDSNNKLSVFIRPTILN